MQITLVEKTGDSATIAFTDANITLIAPLMKALDEDENVELVRFIETHPELDDRQLYVKMRKGDALDAVAKASQAVSDYYSEIKE